MASTGLLPQPVARSSNVSVGAGAETTYPPDNPNTTYSTAAYNAAIAQGATPAQASQFAGSQQQYASDPAQAKSIVPGESYSAATAREQAAGLPVGTSVGQSGAPTAGTAGTPAASPASPGSSSSGSSMTPAYLSSLFPNGIPTAGTTQTGPTAQVNSPNLINSIMAASNALPQVGTSQVGTDGVAAPPSVGTSPVGTSNVATNSILGSVGNQIGAQPFQSEVTSAMQPQFAANQHALDEELANAGIVGGSTTGADVDLANSENTQLAGALAPYEQTAQNQILQAATSDAGNTLSASGQNATNTLTASGQNAGNTLAGQTTNAGNLLNANEATAANELSASGQNAANALTATGQNAGNAISTGTSAVNQILQAQQANQSADLSNQQFNTGQANANTQFNTTNQLQAGQADVNAFNTSQQQAANINNQDWLQQLIGQQQLASGGQQGQTNAYTSTFQQPGQSSLSGFAPTIALPQPKPATPAPATGSNGAVGQYATAQ